VFVCWPEAASRIASRHTGLSLRLCCMCFALPTLKQDRRVDQKSVKPFYHKASGQCLCMFRRQALPVTTDNDRSPSKTVRETGNAFANARSISIRFHDIALQCSCRRLHNGSRRTAQYHCSSAAHLTRHSLITYRCRLTKTTMTLTA
jgi:hypothetical protein